jgi:hypothetical protein
MNVSLFKRLKLGWSIDLSTVGNILRIFDGNTTEYIAVFGPKVDTFGMHDFKELSSVEAERYSFERLVTGRLGCPPELTLVLVTLQEGDPMPIEVLELLEVRGEATYTVDAFVRGMDLTFFWLLRRKQGEGEFKLLGLIGPKQRRR